MQTTAVPMQTTAAPVQTAAVPAVTGNLRSPCISVCRIDVASGFCAGCYRTIEEISDWSAMADDRKREVWRELGRRRARLNPVMPTAAPVGDAPSGPALTPAPGRDAS